MQICIQPYVGSDGGLRCLIVQAACDKTYQGMSVYATNVVRGVTSRLTWQNSQRFYLAVYF